MSDSPFMAFWVILNRVAASYDRPPMRYGEARDWWMEYHNEKQVARSPAELIQQLRASAALCSAEQEYRK